MSALPDDPRFAWDIFCRVVDNFGDIGVTWRLARGFARDHHLAVRLWVDDWEAFSRLCPRARGMSGRIEIDGIEVRQWGEPFPAVVPAENVIEAFGCDLPPAYVAAMAACNPKPVWINLEYLSAEPWVSECHQLSSPHPRLPLLKHFFFPGFVAGTGGLLREPGLLAARDRFQAGAGAQGAYLRTLGIAPAPAGARVVSLFAYENPALGALLDAWAESDEPTLLLVPEGRVVAGVARHFGLSAAPAGSRFQDRALDVRILPFVEQDAYDRLLWACDVNFVRGEDSFVRAQWAGRPFVWHIYHQDEEAHRVKLDAFLDLHVEGLDQQASAALRGFWQAWNGRGDVASSWKHFCAARPQLLAHEQRWAHTLAASSELASTLVQFSKNGV
ncbi:elongation factor P maturation arginine rhamnosyltransferase EarP [Aromatoleum sp.]|uniref:elongation factor P maturation arginine rhamnosyltransferase EarP n=1 Tax=Aromatoleum sp. TaxID=2307007 RepID=UPI002FC6E519